MFTHAQIVMGWISCGLVLVSVLGLIGFAIWLFFQREKR